MIEHFLPGVILGALVVGTAGYIYLRIRTQVRDIRTRLDRLTRTRVGLVEISSRGRKARTGVWR